MSIKAMQYVFDSQTTKGSQRLMLLAIADRCDDEGVCYPGVPYLAQKCNVTRGTALKTIQNLESIGELRVVEGDGIETGHGSTNRYVMVKYRVSIGLGSQEFDFRPIKVDTPIKNDTSRPIKVDTSRPIKVDTQSKNVSQDKAQDIASDDATTPKEKPIAQDKQKTSPEYDPKQNAYDLAQVIPKLLGLYNGREWQIAHMLSGTAKKKGYKEYSPYFTEQKMVTPDELKRVVAFYRETYPDAPIMQSPEVISDWVGKYRAKQARPARTVLSVDEIGERNRRGLEASREVQGDDFFYPQAQ